MCVCSPHEQMTRGVLLHTCVCPEKVQHTHITCCSWPLSAAAPSKPHLWHQAPQVCLLLASCPASAAAGGGAGGGPCCLHKLLQALHQRLLQQGGGCGARWWLDGCVAAWCRIRWKDRGVWLPPQTHPLFPTPYSYSWPLPCYSPHDTCHLAAAGVVSTLWCLPLLLFFLHPSLSTHPSLPSHLAAR